MPTYQPIFKLVPKYSPAAVGGAAGIVGGLGAFGGFLIPLMMGAFIRFSGPAGYAQGFSVFLALAALAIGLIVVLNVSGNLTTSPRPPRSVA